MLAIVLLMATKDDAAYELRRDMLGRPTGQRTPGIGLRDLAGAVAALQALGTGQHACTALAELCTRHGVREDVSLPAHDYLLAKRVALSRSARGDEWGAQSGSSPSAVTAPCRRKQRSP